MLYWKIVDRVLTIIFYECGQVLILFCMITERLRAWTVSRDRSANDWVVWNDSDTSYEDVDTRQ